MSATHNKPSLRKSVVVAVAVICLTAGDATAQIVAGTVRDAAGNAVEEAFVSLVNPANMDTVRRPVRPNVNGRFVLVAPKEGSYRVIVNGKGLQPVGSDTITLGAAELAMMEITVSTMPDVPGSAAFTSRRPLSLAELMSPLGFDLRREGKTGMFLGQEELREYGKLPFEAAVRDHGKAMSIEFANDPRTFSSGELLVMRSGVNLCVPEILLDGAPLIATSGAPMARLMTYNAGQIYGLEVYRGSRMPTPRLAGEMGMTAPRCGVVAIWTKARQVQLSQQLWTVPSSRKPN